MKVLTVCGTRPELIRLSRIVPVLDRSCEHVFVHTGQNNDECLHDVFLRELEIRLPDEALGIGSVRFAEQAGLLFPAIDELLARVRPDRVLILGDTNSGLAALVAARRRIPVFHMEAGNRCYDNRVPEEVNRRVIDHCSTVLMPYTQRSKENLVREGFPRDRIFVTGNPIYEVLEHYRKQIDASDVIARLALEPQGYALVTMHRAENVDDPQRLRSMLRALELVSEQHRRPVVVSLHPRTRDQMSTGVTGSSGDVRLLSPLGFFDFVHLERNAFCVISDSGTVQEECSIFGVPNVTVRDVTERPETIEAGSNVLSGVDPSRVAEAVRMVTELPTDWAPPADYTVPGVSGTIARIVLGFRND